MAQSRKAYLLVRSVVSEPALREKFDRWYGTDHTPYARALLGADRAWRYWSTDDPSVHYAQYEFPDLATAQRALSSDSVPLLAKEYEDTWPEHVTRTREILHEASFTAEHRYDVPG